MNHVDIDWQLRTYERTFRHSRRIAARFPDGTVRYARWFLGRPPTVRERMFLVADHRLARMVYAHPLFNDYARLWSDDTPAPLTGIVAMDEARCDAMYALYAV